MRSLALVSGVFLFISVCVVFSPRVAAASGGTVTVTVRVRPPTTVNSKNSLRGSVFDAKASILKSVAMSVSLASDYTQIIPIKIFRMSATSVSALGFA